MEKGFNILILTHGPFGPAIIESSKMILGDSNDLYAIPLDMGMSPNIYESKIREQLNDLTGETLILTDIFGGTTSNVALMISRDFNVTIACGLNLGLLLEILTKREMYTDNLKSFVEDSIKSANELNIVLEIGDDNDV